jgi:hypothetical protein
VFGKFFEIDRHHAILDWQIFVEKVIFFFFLVDILLDAAFVQKIGMYDLMLILQTISYLSDKITKKSSNKENCFRGQKFTS